MKNQLIGGAFEDLEGKPLANGYLIFELSEDAQTGATTIAYITQEDDDLFLLEDDSGFLIEETSSGSGNIGAAQLLTQEDGSFFVEEDGSGFLLLQVSDGSVPVDNGTPQFFLQEDGSFEFLLEDGSGLLQLEQSIAPTPDVQDPPCQIVAGVGVKIILDMLGNIAGTLVTTGGTSLGFGEGGFGEGIFGGGPSGGIATKVTPSIWPNDELIPDDTIYYVTAYKRDGTKVWKTPQQWFIPSSPSPFDVGTLATYPVNTPTPNIVDVLPSLLGIIPTSRFIPSEDNPVLLQVNGVNNGSQIKLNMIAGTGMTITDDLSGNVTFAAATGGGNAPLIVTTSSTSGTLSYGATPWVVELGTSGVGGIARTLPSANGSSGSVFIIKKVDSGIGTLTVNTTGGQTIDGGTTWLLTNEAQYVTVVSDGSNWQIISNN